MNIRSLEFNGKMLRILDQRFLPFEVLYSECRNEKDVWEAINMMKVRGAPAIGVAAAYGIYLGVMDFTGTPDKLLDRMHELKAYLDGARPTAVNLQWATRRIIEKAEQMRNSSVKEIIEKIKNEAILMEEEDALRNKAIGEYGSALIKPKDVILTICNTGELATIRYGTAFCVIKKSFEKYGNTSVIALETRPYLQGARLTAFELKEARIPFKLITDNMSGFVMSKKMVSLVITGADRIAMNGDTANKIGTYMLAVLAQYHNIPFYVAAPVSTIDPSISSGEEIPIEERNPEEVTHFMGKCIAPEGVDALNPSFDMTPSKLITAIITDKGILFPPYQQSIKKAIS